VPTTAPDAVDISIICVERRSGTSYRCLEATALGIYGSRPIDHEKDPGRVQLVSMALKGISVCQHDGGESVDAVDAACPHLTQDQIILASEYAKAYPRRGGPRTTRPGGQARL